MLHRGLALLAITSSVAICGAIADAQTTSLTISAGLAQNHPWVGDHMDPFADAIQERTDGALSFTRFYAGELVAPGRELDSLNAGVINVAAPLLAPFHEGRFPLSDISQLPIYNSTTLMATEAFQELLDSTVEIAPSMTFYEYEIASKDIVAWALGATTPFVISTTGRELRLPEDFRGMPLRAGSALHTMVLEQLGANAVMMPGTQAYEALSRGTIDGMTTNVSDWFAFSFQDVLRYTVMDASIGHFQSYLAVSRATWDALSAEQQQLWDQTAREIAIQNSGVWQNNLAGVIAATEPLGAKFVSINELPAETQAYFGEASLNTWISWIERTEAAGHPAKETAKLWAELMTERGATLPNGVAEYLEK